MKRRNLKRSASLVCLAVLMATVTLLPCLISTSRVRAEETPQIEWYRQFGTDTGDFAFGVFAGSTGIYVAGRTEGALPDQSSAGLEDAFVRKYDSSGSVGWTRQFGTDTSDCAAGIYADSTSIYVAGWTDGVFPGQSSAGGRDAFVRKYDSSGTVGWTRQFGSGGDDYGYGISADSTGIYVAGFATGALPNQSSSGGYDAFVRKYDFSGNHLWTHQFGTATADPALGISADSTGVYVAGLTGGTLPDQSSAGLEDAFVRKYDSSGNLLWTRQFGTASNDYANGISVDPTGIYVAGQTSGVFPDESSSGGYDAFVRKYDFSGNHLWTHQFGTASYDSVNGVSADPTGIYVAGQTSGVFPDESSSGGWDAFVRKYDTSGNHLWTHQFGTASSDAAAGISADPTGIYVAGSIAEDAFVIKWASMPTPTPEWRRNIQEGDILVNRTASTRACLGQTWTHAGIYVGDGKVVEARFDNEGGIEYYPIEDWDDYAMRDLLRVVSASEEQKAGAVQFAKEQAERGSRGEVHYRAWVGKCSDPSVTAWYCSELVWASYYRQGIDLDRSSTGWDCTSFDWVTPDDIHDDNDIQVINHYQQEYPPCEPSLGAIFKIFSPVDLIVVDPDGLTINKELLGIPGGLYIEGDIDGDGELNDIVVLEDRKVGDYLISVIPEPDASPTDTYTLKVSAGGTTIVLAQNNPISEIPDQGYGIESKESNINAAPIADANGPYLAAKGSSITFDSSGSYDPESSALSYGWDFGDGFYGTSASPTHSYTAPGLYNAALTVTDDEGAQSTDSTLVVVYDPSAGFVTGGGWINSPPEAYTPDPLLTGKATFGFVSRYKKGATTPTGVTEFQFKVADLNFHSDSYQWLVIAGAKAIYKGVGTINGEGNYGFMLSAIDAGLTPQKDDVDTFRIKIWDKDNGDTVVYDNHIGASEDANPSAAIAGGSIVIHK